MKYDAEFYQYDSIMRRKLERVPNTLDKRESSVIYTAMAPSSAVDAEIYSELRHRYNESFADTCSREYLIRRCQEQGISPYPATRAVITARFEGALPNEGDRFSLANSEVNFEVTDIIDGVYYLTCETLGSAGNVYSGKLLPIADIPGLTSATVESLYSMGDDEEDTESLRQRYFDVFKFSRPFAGNVSGFVELTNSLDGVGATKVFRAWNGGGTCKLVILNSEMDVPSDTLVTNIQNEIDPTIGDASDSGGVGLAPIFCRTTVVGAKATVIDIRATLTYRTGYDWNTCKPLILSAIEDYFDTLTLEWQDSDQTEVKVTGIMMAVLNVPGVSDMANVTINGSSANLLLPVENIPKRGTFNGE